MKDKTDEELRQELLTVDGKGRKYKEECLKEIERRIIAEETLKRVHKSLGHVHPLSPKIGDVIECTNEDMKLKDKGGYKVEHVGWSNGTGLSYGYFAARGVCQGGLYRISVTDWKFKK